MYKKVVVKLTGSLFDFGQNINELLNIAETVKKLVKERRMKFFFVAGGGETLRKYINLLRKKRISEILLDRIGIEFTRLNALIFTALLGKFAWQKVPVTLDEVISLLEVEKVISVGGLIPGFSTNAVSALIAEMVNADLLIVMSRAGAVYDKDPEKFKEAKQISEIKIDQLRKMLSSVWSRAGYYPLLDHTSIEIINRSKIPTVIIPSTAKALREVINGKKIGTRILF